MPMSSMLKFVVYAIIGFAILAILLPYLLGINLGSTQMLAKALGLIGTHA